MLICCFFFLASAIAFYACGAYFEWMSLRTRCSSYIDIAERFDYGAVMFGVFSAICGAIWFFF